MESQELQHQLQVVQADMEKERKGRQQAEEKNIELTRKTEVTTGEGEGRRREEEEGGGGGRRGRGEERRERGGRREGEGRGEEGRGRGRGEEGVSTTCNGCIS